MWRLLCRFSTAQLKPDRFFPYVQQAYFDMKNPASATKNESHVKKGNFKFRFITRHDTNGHGSTPSTSTKENLSPPHQSATEIEDIMASSHSDVIDMDDDIVESSQNVTTPIAKSRLRKQQSDLINFINIIDSNCAGNSSANNNVDDRTKLHAMEMRKGGNNVVDLNDSFLMEVDGGNIEEKVVAVQATSSGDFVKVKSKITDYFSNVNK